MNTAEQRTAIVAGSVKWVQVSSMITHNGMATMPVSFHKTAVAAAVRAAANNRRLLHLVHAPAGWLATGGGHLIVVVLPSPGLCF